MNIRKVGVYNKETKYIEQKVSYTHTEWRKILGYKTRGYKNKVGRISRSKTIIHNFIITKHIRRNRVYNLVYNSAGGACEVQ